MGGTTMKKLLIIVGLLFLTNGIADQFSDFKKQQEAGYSLYKKTIEEQFLEYRKAHQEAFNEFSKEIEEKWPNYNGKAVLSTKNRYVEYAKNLNSKKIVDYAKKNISLEVIATTQEEAKKKLAVMFDNLLKETVKTAHKKDLLEKKIAVKLKKPLKVVTSNKQLIADILTAREKASMKDTLQNQDLTVVKYKGKFIYKANVKMPADSMIRKAKTFKKEVLANSQKQEIPAELVFAIMHSESSFNPMARSHIPAFGLMQIVPKSAGVDSYQYLYKKKKILSSEYLYDSSKNITIGSGYLHILY